MYTWFATQVICNTRRFSFRLCYEIPDHLYTPTVGFSSIQISTMEILGATINVYSERSEFKDRSHGLRVCTHRGPSFSPSKLHPSMDISQFPRSIQVTRSESIFECLHKRPRISLRRLPENGKGLRQSFITLHPHGMEIVMDRSYVMSVVTVLLFGIQ